MLKELGLYLTGAILLIRRWGQVKGHLMTKELTVKKGGDKPAPYSQEQIELIKRTVAKDATNDELKLFLIVAARSGLDPFSRQIHFVKRKGQGTFQTGIDGYRAIAERSRSLAGIDDPIYDTEDEAHPNKASVTVYRLIDGIKSSFTASARWNEYVPGPGQDFMWRKMPYLMLGKVAEALALRKAFPNDLSGLYTHEEMAQADNEPTQPTNPVKQVEPKTVSTIQPAKLSDITLDFIQKLESANKIEEYEDVCTAIRDARQSGHISQAENAALVNAAKKAARRIEDALKQPPVIDGAIEESSIPQEEVDRIAEEVGFI